MPTIPAVNIPAIENYRPRFNARPETFDALLDVWERSTAVRVSFRSWHRFGRCAIEEPSKYAEDTHARDVLLAQCFMRDHGYVPDGPKKPNVGLRWLRP